MSLFSCDRSRWPAYLHLSPHYVYNQQVGEARWQFLLDSMEDVSAGLKKLNPKQQLFVVRGPPTTVLKALWKEWKITDIVFEKDDDTYTAVRDAQVTELAKEAGVKVHVVNGHTLYDAAVIAREGKGHVPRTYNAFQKILDKLPSPPLPIPTPKSLPDPGSNELKGWTREDHSVEKYKENDLNKEWRETGTTERDQSYESFSGPNGDFAVPTMKELGFETQSKVRGGERRALERFEEYMQVRAYSV